MLEEDRAAARGLAGDDVRDVLLLVVVGARGVRVIDRPEGARLGVAERDRGLLFVRDEKLREERGWLAPAGGVADERREVDGR